MAHPMAVLVEPVAFLFGPAEAGWISLCIRTGVQEDSIHCSHVFDPFEELVEFFDKSLDGDICAMEIDEEGPTTKLWITREPGEHIGRLRVFEPGEGGRPDPLRIDAFVDIPRMAGAFLEAFEAYARSYDAAQWDEEPEDGRPIRRSLEEIRLAGLRWGLEWLGLVPPSEDSRAGSPDMADYRARCMRAYADETGAEVPFPPEVRSPS